MWMDTITHIPQIDSGVKTGKVWTVTYNYCTNSDRQPNSGSSCIGTDPNRNYGYMWSGPGASGNPCSETYYGVLTIQRIY